MSKFLSRAFLLLSLNFISCQYIEYIPKPRPDASPTGPEAVNVLIQLLNLQESGQMFSYLAALSSFTCAVAEKGAIGCWCGRY
jgi:hypothetical protein